jgi:osmoprotectant transport system ATP-binding protein
MITLRGISKVFAAADVPAVDDLWLEVGRGETVVLLGSSGSGKTTALKMINRLIEPSSGTITLDGIEIRSRDVLELRRRIGYVFQDIGLFPHMTVAENVAIVGRLLGWPRMRRRDRARVLLGLVGLDGEEHGDRYPRQLSGGQQQRVGLARALAAEPDVLLMDEPFGALDAVTRDQLQGDLLEMRQSLGMTIVFVTHDLFEAMRIGDRIGVMHEGRLDQIGTGDELLAHPATAYVADLMSQAKRQAAFLGRSAS